MTWDPGNCGADGSRHGRYRGRPTERGAITLLEGLLPHDNIRTDRNEDKTKGLGYREAF
jgi:hypothetical protein